MKELFSKYNCITGIFSNLNQLIDFLEECKKNEHRILDIIVPLNYPELSGYLPSRDRKYGLVAFISGIVGLFISLSFIIYFFKIPLLQYGGNIVFKFAYIVPILFLFTVFFASLGLMLYLMITSHLLPGQVSYIPDYLQGMDQFIVIVYAGNEKDRIKKIMESCNAIHITEKEQIVLNYNIPVPLKIVKWKKH
jgi:hypothetical protein